METTILRAATKQAAKRANKTAPEAIPEPEDHDHAECRAAGQVLDRIGDKWTVMQSSCRLQSELRMLF